MWETNFHKDTQHTLISVWQVVTPAAQYIQRYLVYKYGKLPPVIRWMHTETNQICTLQKQETEHTVQIISMFIHKCMFAKTSTCCARSMWRVTIDWQSQVKGEIFPGLAAICSCRMPALAFILPHLLCFIITPSPLVNRQTEPWGAQTSC